MDKNVTVPESMITMLFGDVTALHTIQDDMAVTYHILFSKDKNGIASAPINEGMLETYGVTVEQLHEDAMQNCLLG